MKRYICGICGFVYDEAVGMPDQGIPAGTRWEDLPADWVCPICGASKSEFSPEAGSSESEGSAVPAGAIQDSPMQADADPAGVRTDGSAASPAADDDQDAMREMSFGEVSAICSNLALACQKQQLAREQELFGQLADWFQSKAVPAAGGTFDDLAQKVQQNLVSELPAAKDAAAASSDRGAKRVLTWSEKVTSLLSSLLARYKKEGVGFIEGTNVYVCDICGFVYIGDTPPAICPICKVPSFKLLKLERGNL